MKTKILGIAGVAIGLFAGMALMMGLHMASGLVYPPPEGVDLMGETPAQQAAVVAWIATLPAGAMLLAILAHGLGCMGGAALATLISGRRAWWPAIVVGVLFTIAGIMNLSSVPHPWWFPYLDLPIYMLLALLAGRLLIRPVAC